MPNVLTITTNPVYITEGDTVDLTVETDQVVVTVGTGVTDHGSLTGLADDDHPQYLTQARADALYGSTSLTLALRASILATSPTAGALAFSTDTHEFYVFTGTAWYKASTAFV